MIFKYKKVSKSIHKILYQLLQFQYLTTNLTMNIAIYWIRVSLILLDKFRLALSNDQEISQGMLTQALKDAQKGGSKIVEGNLSTGPKGNSGKKPTTSPGDLYSYT